MPFTFTTGVYVPPSGAESASSGQVIASATWNTIFTDLSNALTNVGQNLWVPRTVSGNFTVLALDYVVQVTANSASVVLPASSLKTGPLHLMGAASGIFNSNPCTIYLTGGDVMNGSSNNPCLTLTTAFQAVTFYPVSGVGYVKTAP